MSHDNWLISCLDCPDGFSVQKHCPWLPRFWTCAKFYATGSASILLEQKMLPYSLFHGGSNGNKEVMGTGVQQVRRKLQSFTITSSTCSNWSLYPVTGITGGVGCPSNDLLFQGTASVTLEGDFLTECMSTLAFSYDHKKNNILQQGDKVCSTKVTQQMYSKQNPSFLTKCWIKVWI